MERTIMINKSIYTRKLLKAKACFFQNTNYALSLHNTLGLNILPR
ncbi:hypothetical protein HMPREF9420_2216 [Segatella salivae DSM 15606]|uniref:Uncharacterized protein n=1 Tax=Segatella salivae DSM 15606 TaxID=888832 RepID=E6MRU8_9BACT|nr:hypothetical protein HMPREF9420_2216 [Segatella salivae DSM 15606]